MVRKGVDLTMEEWSEKCNVAGFEHDRRRPQAKEYG